MHDTVCTKRGLSYTIKRYTSCKLDSLSSCIKMKDSMQKRDSLEVWTKSKVKESVSSYTENRKLKRHS